MTQTFEDAGQFGKDLVDNGLKSLTSLSKGLQAIAVETGDYTKKSLRDGQRGTRAPGLGQVAREGDRGPVGLCQAGL